MDINKNLGDIMKEAQKMQQRMQDAQKALSDMRVSGESGGGMVKIDMNGRHEALKVKINPSLLDDVEMLEDLVAAAFNAAGQQVEKATQSKIKDITAGMNIPNDLMNKGE